MTIYETIVILDSLLSPKEIDAMVEEFSGIIKENGGEIRKTEKWGKKRLAYEIQKKQYGFYVSIEFTGPGTIPRELEASYNYNDKVMRYLTYKFDKHQLRALKLQEEADAKVAESAPAPVPAPEAAPVAEETAEVKEEVTQEAPAEEATEAAPEAVADETKENEE